MHTRMFAAAILVSVALLGVRSAHAQDDPEALIRQGNEMRRRGDNALAYGGIKRAYDLSHTPRAAAQLGLIELSIGKVLDSEHHLSDALAAEDPWIDQNRSTLDDSRRKARARLARLELRGSPAGATLEIGDATPTPIPSDGVVWVMPGDTKLRMRPPGATRSSRDHGRRGIGTRSTSTCRRRRRLSSFRATSGLRPERPLPARERRRGVGGPDTGATKRTAGLVTAGVGAAVGIAGFFVYRAERTRSTRSRRRHERRKLLTRPTAAGRRSATPASR
jgi:hypothetical protein